MVLTLYLQREQVLLQGIQRVTLPCFYSSPERTNNTLFLERAFVFAAATVRENKVRVCSLLQSALISPGFNLAMPANPRLKSGYPTLECANVNTFIAQG